MTSTTVQALPRTVEAGTRHLPGTDDDLAWTAELVCDIAQVPPCGSPQELIDTYGTDDPDQLRAFFALPDDVAAAEQFAAEVPRVAA